MAQRAGRKVVIANSRRSMQPAQLDGRSSSEVVAELVASARVVKAANTLGAELLGADPRDAGGRRVSPRRASVDHSDRDVDRGRLPARLSRGEFEWK